MLSRKEKIGASLFGFTVSTVLVLYAVLTSDSSTAVIGLIFVPVYGALAALLALGALYLWKKNQFTRLLLVILMSLSAAAYYRKHSMMRQATDPQAEAATLTTLTQSWIPFGRQDVLLALAGNPAAPGELLHELSQLPDSSIQGAVAQNPATGMATLNMLLQKPKDYYLFGALALNPNLTESQIDIILQVDSAMFPSPTEYRLYQNSVLGPLARHPNLSEVQFQTLLNWPQPEYFLVYGLIESGRADCAWLQKQATERTDALQGNASTQLQEQNCQ